MNVLGNIINRIQKIKNKEETTHAIKSGIVTLDTILSGGFTPGLYIVTGKELIGKTAFLITLISNIIHNRNESIKAGVISLDLSEHLWMERMLSNLSEIWLEKIARGRLEEHERSKLFDLASAAGFDNLFISAAGYITLQELITTCTAWVRKHNVRIIFIDYLQLISVENISDDELKIATIAAALKKISLDLNIPIILSVALQDPQNCTFLQLKDLRKEGAIEPFADCILFLNKPHNYDSLDDDINERETYIRIAKNHNGQLDTITITALLHIQKFLEFNH